MSQQFQGQIALITGGTTGIGFATAKALITEGAQVIVTGRNPKSLAHAKAELGPRAEVIASDAADEVEVKRLFARIREQFGRLDVVFLNAGIAKFGAIPEASLAEFDEMWRINIRGPWLALREALPLLGEGGSIVVNTSVVDVKGMAGTSAYSATKAALRSLVRTAAAELAPRKIRINAVSPGPIETPIFEKSGLGPQEVAGFLANVTPQVPLGRIGRAEEVAAATLFLASKGASFITGSELAVDGGLAQI